jgi:hypothetical protein
VGGWSDECGAAFRTLKQGEASIVAGYELAGKTTLPYGLFAAPALLDRVIRDDRNAGPQKASLYDAVEDTSASFQERFGPATELNGDLLPVSLALRLSSEAGEDDDWRPRFRRRVGVSADEKLGPHDLALQIYREILIARVLPKPK